MSSRRIGTAKRRFRTYDYVPGKGEFHRRGREGLAKYGIGMGSYTRTVQSTRKRWWWLGCAAAGAAVFWAVNRREIPFSRRVQFIGLPDWIDNYLGDLAYSGEEGEIYDLSHPYTLIVERLTNDILTVLRNNTEQHPYLNVCIEDWKWKICVVRDNSCNAYCAPSGKIVVHDALIRQLGWGGLYFVLAHEVGHAVARHGTEGVLLSFATDFVVSLAQGGGVEDVSVSMLDCRSSKKAETEADLIGFHIMRAAGVPTTPEVFEHVFTVLNDGEPFGEMDTTSFLSRLLSLFSTHPSPVDRYAALLHVDEVTPLPDAAPAAFAQPLSPCIPTEPANCSESLVWTPLIEQPGHRSHRHI